MASKNRKGAWTDLFPEPIPVGDGLGLLVSVSPDVEWMASSLVELQPRGSRSVFRVEDFLAGNRAKVASTAANCKGYNRGPSQEATFAHEDRVKAGLSPSKK